MKWIKAKDQLPNHRQKVIFSPAGKSVLEATFFEKYVSSEHDEDLGPTFRSISGALFHWYDLTDSDFQWMKYPDFPER